MENHNIDPKMLEMLVCPFTKTRLELSASGKELVSHAARLAFPIEEGVPLLVLDSARRLKEDELR
ncbi:Trm112 family protein [Maritalea mediterranea]|uniref:UPF0434 protein L1I42_00180 n=1 Tax=Maritalea mediterranea TaxID=2909667 RepID=A0ABS9E4T1_9HYPH|nr:Trm112 family protein [Maritalea mediterranea]MCF4096899.1 Trm112 family protein [Maritalea mediterranea]